MARQQQPAGRNGQVQHTRTEQTETAPRREPTVAEVQQQQIGQLQQHLAATQRSLGQRVTELDFLHERLAAVQQELHRRIQELQAENARLKDAQSEAKRPAL